MHAQTVPRRELRRDGARGDSRARLGWRASELLVHEIRAAFESAVEHGTPPPLLELELAAVAQVAFERRLELGRDVRVEYADTDLLVQGE